MNKLIERIKDDVLKSSVVVTAFVVFVAGIVVTAMNTGDTYAASVTPDTIVKATFDANGGSVSPTSSTCSYNVGDGELECTIALPTPTRNGYIFTGWNGSLKGSTKIASDTTFTASWSINRAETPDTIVKAIFDANGGSVTPTSSTCSYNVGDGELECTVSLPTPTRSGYTFDGWRTSTGGLLKGSTTIASDTTFTAYWTPNSAATPDTIVKATFNANGGSVTPTSKTCSYNVGDGELECTVSLPTPTRSGYIFDGWCKGSSSCSSAIKGSIKIESDTTFYATWSEDSSNPSNPDNPNNDDEIVEGGTGTDSNKPSTPDNPNNDDEIVEGGTGTDSNKPSTPDNPNNDDEIVEGGTGIDSNKPSTPDNPKTDDELKENEKTGDILITIVWVIGLGALGYSVYYFMKQRNTI